MRLTPFSLNLALPHVPGRYARDVAIGFSGALGCNTTREKPVSSRRTLVGIPRAKDPAALTPEDILVEGVTDICSLVNTLAFVTGYPFCFVRPAPKRLIVAAQRIPRSAGRMPFKTCSFLTRKLVFALSRRRRGRQPAWPRPARAGPFRRVNRDLVNHISRPLKQSPVSQSCRGALRDQILPAYREHLKICGIFPASGKRLPMDSTCSITRPHLALALTY